MVNLVRYADDFIITSAEKEVLEREIKPYVGRISLLKEVWSCQKKKTVITHTLATVLVFLALTSESLKAFC